MQSMLPHAECQTLLCRFRTSAETSDWSLPASLQCKKPLGLKLVELGRIGVVLSRVLQLPGACRMLL